MPLPGIDLRTAVLPVSWSEAVEMNRALVARHDPDAILHFGVSKRAAGFVIETCAYNIRDGRRDNQGRTCARDRIFPSMPEIQRSTLPCAELAAALRRSGLPARLSTDPGRYLCNTVLFASLCEAAAYGGPRVAFIHVPALGVVTDTPPALSESGLLEGSRILIRTAARAVLRERTGGRMGVKRNAAS